MTRAALVERPENVTLTSELNLMRTPSSSVFRALVIGLCLEVASSCSIGESRKGAEPAGPAAAQKTTGSPAADSVAPPGRAIATFAGGCFWCMEQPFEKLAGVVSVTSGYTGGKVPNPTYEEVGSGATGHAESIRIVYDPRR